VSYEDGWGRDKSHDYSPETKKHDRSVPKVLFRRRLLKIHVQNVRIHVDARCVHPAKLPFLNCVLYGIKMYAKRLHVHKVAYETKILGLRLCNRTGVLRQC
jgi:hypothetical protein